MGNQPRRWKVDLKEDLKEECKVLSFLRIIKTPDYRSFYYPQFVITYRVIIILANKFYLIISSYGK